MTRRWPSRDDDDDSSDASSSFVLLFSLFWFCFEDDELFSVVVYNRPTPANLKSLSSLEKAKVDDDSGPLSSTAVAGRIQKAEGHLLDGSSDGKYSQQLLLLRSEVTTNDLDGYNKSKTFTTISNAGANNFVI